MVLLTVSFNYSVNAEQILIDYNLYLVQIHCENAHIIKQA